MKRVAILLLIGLFLAGCGAKEEPLPEENLDAAINAMTELEALGIE